MTNRITKESKIIELLKAGGHITTWDAIQKFRYTRLPHLIYKMRKQGYEFCEKSHPMPGGSRYIEWWLKENCQEILVGLPRCMSQGVNTNHTAYK